MIKEKILNDFTKWDLEKQKEELKKLKNVKEYIGLTESDLELLHMIIENKMVNVNIKCDDEKCYIINEDESVEYNSIEDNSIEYNSIEDNSIEDEPVEDEPVEDNSIEDNSIEDEPVEDNSIEDEPVEDEPVEDNSIEDEPVEDEPVEDIDKMNDVALKKTNIDFDNIDTEKTQKSGKKDEVMQMKNLENIINNIMTNNTNIINAILKSNNENNQLNMSNINENFDFLRNQILNIISEIKDIKQNQKKIMETLNAFLNDEKNYGFEQLSQEEKNDKKNVK
jgi:hypothetical protein